MSIETLRLDRTVRARRRQTEKHHRQKVEHRINKKTLPPIGGKVFYTIKAKIKQPIPLQ